MKWMGWSWDDYLRTPEDVVSVVIELIKEEAESRENF